MKQEDIKIKPAWSKSKEQIWEEQFAGLEDKKTVLRLHKKTIWRYVAAAAIAILFILPLTAYLYNEEVVVPKGEHQLVILPDGSKVDINADSRLSYKPYWWRFVRDVELVGEAYFEVVPGSTFAVNAGGTRVTVLGTSFNVYSRSKEYQHVTCLTGKVQVAKAKEHAILTANMRAEINKNTLKVDKMADASPFIGWTRDHFIFLSVPLNEVIKEVERQYNIKVVATSKLDYLYTGNFSKAKTPEEVLEIIGKPFGVEFKIER